MWEVQRRRWPAGRWAGTFPSTEFQAEDPYWATLKRVLTSPPGSQFLDPDGWFPNHAPKPCAGHSSDPQACVLPTPRQPVPGPGRLVPQPRAQPRGQGRHDRRRQGRQPVRHPPLPVHISSFRVPSELRRYATSNPSAVASCWREGSSLPRNPAEAVMGLQKNMRVCGRPPCLVQMMCVHSHILNPDRLRVRRSHADLGIVVDTDVDRSAVVAGNGQPINSNRYIALMAYITLRRRPCCKSCRLTTRPLTLCTPCRRGSSQVCAGWQRTDLSAPRSC